MSLDPITEIISHFSGFFSLAVEQARMREQYEEFQAEKAQEEDQSELLNIDIEVHSKYGFQDFSPDLDYIPAFEFVDPLYVSSFVDFNPLPTNLFFDVAYPFFVAGSVGFVSGSPELNYIFPQPPYPGSLAFVLKQTNVLTDNDFIDMTGLYSDYESYRDNEFELDHLIGQAEVHSPISPLDPPSSEEAIAGLIEQVAAEIQSYNETYQEQEGVSASFGAEAFGTHVNGVVGVEAPVLADNMPEPLKSQNGAEEPEELPSKVEGEGLIGSQSSVDLAAGENLLVNEVSLVSTWSASAVVAVNGDAHDINTISQINVWSDSDSFSDYFSKDNISSTATNAYNIASVSIAANPRIQVNEDDEAEELIFPVAWSVTRLDANLVFLNTVDQVNFVSDSDVHVMTATSHESMVITGGNIATNSLSMLDIMNGYDLIVVAGDYYNANIIIQTNILLDNDEFNALGSPYADNVSTSDFTSGGNLLWNQASIHSIGETKFESMSEEFQSMADGFASGSDSISAAVLTNPLFSGLFGLSVLYINGDILDLQYISQTNILGDNDVIGLLADEVSEATNTSWEISSGENALINVAEIIDVGPDATIMVGGEHYSDALIHQAELAPDIPINQNDNGLVSEAVVFLVDDMMETEQGTGEIAPEHIGQPQSDSDLMQTMLS